MQNHANNNESIDEGEEHSLLSELAFKYVPYWPLFILMIIFSLACAYAYLRYTTPIYAATANILIKDEDKGVYESQITEALNPLGANKIIENEIVILQSKTLMKEVVKNLHLYAPIYTKGRIRSSSAYTSSPVRIEAKNPESVSENYDVPFYFNNKTLSITLNNYHYSINEWLKIGKDSIRFAINPIKDTSEKVKVAYPLYFSLLKIDNAAGSFNVSANISNKLSTVVDLQIEDEVPERAVDIINNLIQVYNQASIEDKNSLAASTLAFVEQRLRYVVNELDSVEGALQTYKSSQEIVDISSQGQLFLQSVGETDKQVSQINIQQAVLDQVEQYVLMNEKTSAVVPSTFGISDPVLTQLLARLYDLEIQYERLRKSTAKNNPALVSLRGQIETMKPSILENIRSQRTNLNVAKNKLIGTSSTFSSTLINSKIS